MSQKYANLPDIDASQDVYETPDQPPSPILKPEDLENEERLRAQKVQRDREKEREREAREARRRNGKQTEELPEEEEEMAELVVTSGVGVEEGAKKWRRKERKGARRRDFTSTFEVEETPVQRFARLQQELAELEDHIEKEKEGAKQKGKARAQDANDEGGMMKSLLELRERLGKIEGLEEDEGDEEDRVPPATNGSAHPSSAGPAGPSTALTSSSVDLVALDKRLASLEHLLGSSNLSSVQPHPPPLLSTMTKLETQMTLLTQPRHLDGLSRRLKVLLTDLERYEKGQAHAQANPQPQPTWGPSPQGRRNSRAVIHEPPPPPPSQQKEPPHAALLTFMSRLDPLLPTIPPLLLRLRSLSTLHASASTFSSRLKEAEEREKAMEQGLEELERAVEKMEESLRTNAAVVKGNMEGLEGRIAEVAMRLEELDDVGDHGIAM